MAESSKPIEQLSVKLTPDEIEMNARALGEAVQKKRDVEAVLASQKAAAKTQLEALDTEIAQRSRVAVSGTEQRPVPVQYKKDFARGTVTTVRLDTFEIVGSRPMNDAERQAGLFERDVEDEYSKVVDEVVGRKAAKHPSKAVVDLAKDIREFEKKVPGFTDGFVKPILDSRTKKRGGAAKSSHP